MIIASKAIKGSVFEIEMPSSGIRQYVVISDNSYNSRNNNCMLAVVCQEKEISKDNNNDYHATFELLIGNMPIKHVVCCERIYTLDQKRLKNYKYHLSEDIIEKVDTALMNVYFGKQMYTYEQMLIKREEEKIRLKVKYSSDALNCVPDKKEEANKQYDNIIENPNASIDEIQNIYASMMPDDATIYSQNKEELFNPVINEDVINKIIDEVQEEKEEVIESKVVLIRKEKKDKHKAVASKKIKEKKVADIVNEVIESRQEESVKRKNTSRKDIWNNPDIFLLDFLTITKEDLYKKYSIKTLASCDKIRETAIKKAKENGIDISFYFEEIKSRKGKINV